MLAAEMRSFCLRCLLVAGVLLAIPGCSKIVYEHRDGRLSRGTFTFLKEIYYAGQFEEEETAEKRNRAIVEDLADLDAVGALATRKGLRSDGYYGEYLYRQQHARHGKAAIYHWRNKYKEKFNWQMLFGAEKLAYDEVDVIKTIQEAAAAGKDVRGIKVAEFEGDPVYYGDLKGVMTVSDYLQFPGYSKQALEAGMREVLKSWLEKKIHDRLLKAMNADENELKRFDHNRVAILFLKVKYGKAGKGIYPAAMEKIPLLPQEIYDHFYKMQNAMADVLWVKAAYTVVAEESHSEELLAKLEKGESLEKLAPKYAAAPKFIPTARPAIIQGYDYKKDPDAREKRPYYDRLILDMAGRDVMKPEPYLGRDGIVIVRIYDVARALAKVKLEDVIWKVENDLRTKMLNQIYEPDVRDSRKALKFQFNEYLIKRLP